MRSQSFPKTGNVSDRCEAERAELSRLTAGGPGPLVGSRGVGGQGGEAPEARGFLHIWHPRRGDFIVFKSSFVLELQGFEMLTFLYLSM